MQARRRQLLRLVGTWALVFVHAWFALLAGFDRLSYTQRSEYELIEYAVDSDLWGWIFGLIGLGLALTLARNPVQHRRIISKGCSVSAAFLGVWAFFTLMWGLTTTFPVSLAVFGPAVFAVVGAQVLAVSWNHGE